MIEKNNIIAIQNGAYKSALLKGYNIHDANDLAGDVVLKALESKRTLVFENINKAYQWGSVSAKNLILDRQRKNKLKFTCFDFTRYWEYL